MIGRVYVCMENTFVFKCKGDAPIGITLRSLLVSRAACTDLDPCWQLAGDLTRNFMQAQDYFMWLLVLSIVVAAIVAYTLAHLIHYLLHVRRTRKGDAHSSVFSYAQSDPFDVAFTGNDDPRLSQKLTGVPSAAGANKGSRLSSIRLRPRSRNNLVLENDRVVRKVDAPAEPPAERHSGLSTSTPLRLDELAPLDPGESQSIADLVRQASSSQLGAPQDTLPARRAEAEPAAEAVPKEKEEEAADDRSIVFGEAAQDPFASLLQSPRTALEKTLTIPRAATRRAGVGALFERGEDEESQSSISREAGLRLAAALGDDKHVAFEEGAASVRAEQEPQSEDDSGTSRDTDEEEAQSGSNEAGSKHSARKGNTAEVSIPGSLAVPLSVVEEAEQLEPVGTVLTELPGPVRLHREEISLPPVVELAPPPHREVVAHLPQTAPPLQQRYDSPKLQQVAELVERYMPPPLPQEAQKKTEATKQDESGDSASFEDYPDAGLPEPPASQELSAAFVADDLNVRALPEPPQESPRVVAGALPEPPVSPRRRSTLRESAPEPPSESPRTWKDQSMPEPPQESPRTTERLPDPPSSLRHVQSEVMPQPPSDTPRLPPDEAASKAPEAPTPRFKEPPPTPRLPEDHDSETFDVEQAEPLPDPPRSEVFRPAEGNEWAAPPSDEEELDRSQLEDSADAPDRSQVDTDSLRPPSSKSSMRSAFIDDLDAPLVLTQPRERLQGSMRPGSEDGISGLRPTTLRSAAELPMPEMEAPESFFSPPPPPMETLRGSDEMGISGRRPTTLRSASELEAPK